MKGSFEKPNPSARLGKCPKGTETLLFPENCHLCPLSKSRVVYPVVTFNCEKKLYFNSYMTLVESMVSKNRTNAHAWGLQFKVQKLMSVNNEQAANLLP